MIYLIYFGIVAAIGGTELVSANLGLAGNILKSVGYLLLICGLTILNERTKK